MLKRTPKLQCLVLTLAILHSGSCLDAEPNAGNNTSNTHTSGYNSNGTLMPQPKAAPMIDAFKPILNDLEKRFKFATGSPVVVVSVTEQQLHLIHNNSVKSYPISTATNGTGSLSGSNKTPLGVHEVKKKFGDGAPLGTIFKARGNTGRIAKILTGANESSQEDIVSTRILWLSGLEKGLNQGGNVDSFKRYIYIHGTDEEGKIGQPASHGCIRMKNQDVVTLYKALPLNSPVVILP